MDGNARFVVERTTRMICGETMIGLKRHFTSARFTSLLQSSKPRVVALSSSIRMFC